MPRQRLPAPTSGPFCRPSGIIWALRSARMETRNSIREVRQHGRVVSESGKAHDRTGRLTVAGGASVPRAGAPARDFLRGRGTDRTEFRVHRFSPPFRTYFTTGTGRRKGRVEQLLKRRETVRGGVKEVARWIPRAGRRRKRENHRARKAIIRRRRSAGRFSAG